MSNPEGASSESTGAAPSFAHLISWALSPRRPLEAVSDEAVEYEVECASPGKAHNDADPNLFDHRQLLCSHRSHFP